MKPYRVHGAVRIYHGDCLRVVPTLGPCDAVVTDPPYGLGFMGKDWDHGVPGVQFWREVYRVLKPGGHLLAFGGTRTHHRLVCAIEDAGFEIRDEIQWLYGSGFPKSLDIGKAIDKRGGVSVAWFGPWFRAWRESRAITQKEVAALFPSKTGGLTGCVANWELGFNMPTPEQFNTIRDKFGLPFADVKEAEREVVGKHTTDMGGLGGQRLGEAGGDITAPATPEAQHWDGWGTALKPACEPICVARKPLEGTVAENVLQHGTGGINVDGCRVAHQSSADFATCSAKNPGRSDTVTSGTYGANRPQQSVNVSGRWPANVLLTHADGCNGECVDSCPVAQLGDAARFFYTAKASRSERRENNNHPTVKPLALMRYLCRLVTPPGGTVLDPFCGSGTTLIAAQQLGLAAVGIDIEERHCHIAAARVASEPIIEPDEVESALPTERQLSLWEATG